MTVADHELREWESTLRRALPADALPLRLASAYRDARLTLRRRADEIALLLRAAGLPEHTDPSRAVVVIRDRVARGAEYVAHTNR